MDRHDKMLLASQSREYYSWATEDTALHHRHRLSKHVHSQWNCLKRYVRRNTHLSEQIWLNRFLKMQHYKLTTEEESCHMWHLNQTTSRDLDAFQGTFLLLQDRSLLPRPIQCVFHVEYEVTQHNITVWQAGCVTAHSWSFQNLPHTSKQKTESLHHISLNYPILSKDFNNSLLCRIQFSTLCCQAFTCKTKCVSLTWR